MLRSLPDASSTLPYCLRRTTPFLPLLPACVISHTFPCCYHRPLHPSTVLTSSPTPLLPSSYPRPPHPSLMLASPPSVLSHPQRTHSCLNSFLVRNLTLNVPWFWYLLSVPRHLSCSGRHSSYQSQSHVPSHRPSHRPSLSQLPVFVHFQPLSFITSLSITPSRNPSPEVTPLTAVSLLYPLWHLSPTHYHPSHHPLPSITPLITVYHHLSPPRTAYHRPSSTTSHC